MYFPALTSFECPYFSPLFRSQTCLGNQALAIGGASLMVGFAFFQMLAFVLMIVIEKDLDGDDDEFSECSGAD